MGEVGVLAGVGGEGLTTITPTTRVHQPEKRNARAEMYKRMNQ